MRRTILVTLALCVAGSAVPAADWPNFRGPSYDGVSKETGLAAKWPEAGPKELWRATPALAGRALYAMGAHGELVALSAADGSEIWRHDLAKEFGAKNPRWGVAASP